MEYTHDIKTIKRWLILLWASIALVYFVYLSLHADRVRSLWYDLITATWSGSSYTNEVDKPSDDVDNVDLPGKDLDDSVLNDNNTKTQDTFQDTQDDDAIDAFSTKPLPNTNHDTHTTGFAKSLTQSFEGMKLRNGKHEIIQKLWLRYQYALKDDDDMYFFFLWSKFYDFRLILEELWWNVVEITNQKDILDNWLSADQITYLKLSAYKNQTLMIVLQQWPDKWLVVVPHRLYYKKKSLIKTLFEQAYKK